MGWYMTPGRRDVCQPTSQLFVGYDLALDLDNTTRADRPQRVTLNTYHNSLLTQAPKPRTLQLWTSHDDGTTWTKIPTTRTSDGRFTATITHPPLARTTGAVTLRVHATDDRGNTVDQTTHRAYGLR